jgi:hypothetical protein
MVSLNAHQFEREVAGLYRSLGASVRHDVTLAGSQIDVLVSQSTTTPDTVTRIVECKAYRSAVGDDAVRSFAGTFRLLHERQLADTATIVSASTFSQSAYRLAKQADIELLEISQLRQRVGRTRTDGNRAVQPPTFSDSPTETHSPRVFVAIPFTKHFDDIYLYGILSAAEKVGYSVERADDDLVSIEVIEYVRERIRHCDLVLADTSEPNPNVFYELGYADGIRKPVVLIATKDAAVPFDVRGRQHLLYDRIRDLEIGLPRFLTRGRSTTER